jgi:hypothetical protein
MEQAAAEAAWLGFSDKLYELGSPFWATWRYRLSQKDP